MRDQKDRFRAVVSFLLLLVLSRVSAAQGLKPTDNVVHPPHGGIALDLSLLGPGVEVAWALTSNSDVRSSFHFFRYSHDVTADGMTWLANLKLSSAQVNYDWFPFGNAFHVTPGLVFYNGNTAGATLSVPAGKVFRWQHKKYLSDPRDPIRGDAGVAFHQVAPALLLGWGSLIGRKRRHFSVPFEFGIVFHGQPKFTFDLSGSACDIKRRGCNSINGDAEGLRDIQNERQSIGREVSAYKFYPVVSVGVAYSF